MSSKELKKALQWIEEKSMEKAYPKSPKKTDVLPRREYEKLKGQILIINEMDYLSSIQPLYEKNIMTATIRKGLFKKIDAFFKSTLDDSIIGKDKETLRQTQKNAKAMLKKDPLDHVYIVSTFDASKGKKYKKNNKVDVSHITAKYLNEITKQDVKVTEISDKHDIGHGDRGMSASEYTMASKARQAADKFDITEKEAKMLQDVVLMEAKKLGIKVNFTHDQVLDSKGNIRKEWSVVLNFQDRKENRGKDKEVEAALKLNIRKRFEKIALNPNSTPLVSAIGQTLMFNFKNRPGMIVKGVRKSKIKESSRARYRKTQRYKRNAGYSVQRGLGIVKGSFKQPRNKKRPNQRTKGYLLESLLNKNLKKTVRDNMGDPALENRTGNFAESVRVVKAFFGKGRTLPSIQYTYAQNPYAVFEMGERGSRNWATPGRDPRILIDKSIREIAAEYALGKFTTQRL